MHEIQNEDRKASKKSRKADMNGNRRILREKLLRYFEDVEKPKNFDTREASSTEGFDN